MAFLKDFDTRRYTERHNKNVYSMRQREEGTSRISRAIEDI